MAWLFFIAAAIAALFVLPGGTRSAQDRRLAQIAAFAAFAAALLSVGLAPLAVAVLVIGATLFGIGWLRDRLTGEGFQNLDEDPSDGERRNRPFPTGSMDRGEALSILGLREGADRDAITAAHRRMIARAHPDQGGSDYLAAKVNEAKETLLR